MRNTALGRVSRALDSKIIEPLTFQGPPPGALLATHVSHGAVTALPWRHAVKNRAAWDALSGSSSEPNPFYESWFSVPSLAAFDPEGSVKILQISHEGELIGLMPISQPSKYYGKPLPHLRNWLHANAFVGSPIVSKGYEPVFWRECLRWMDENAHSALFLHLAAIPLDGPSFKALLNVLQDEQRHWQCVHLESRALLSSRLDPQAYWDSALSAKKRKELRRQFRRLNELGDVRIERCNGSDGLEEWIDDFLKLEASGWKGSEGSALSCAHATEQLFRESLVEASHRGKLERLAMYFDNVPIAMLATFLTPPGAFSFKTAFDEKFSRFSPGVLLQYENLDLLTRSEIDWTDSCASANHPMIDHIWEERREIGHLSIAIGGPLRRFAFRQLCRFETSHYIDRSNV